MRISDTLHLKEKFLYEGILSCVKYGTMFKAIMIIYKIQIDHEKNICCMRHSKSALFKYFIICVTHVVQTFIVFIFIS